MYCIFFHFHPAEFQQRLQLCRLVKKKKKHKVVLFPTVTIPAAAVIP